MIIDIIFILALLAGFYYGYKHGILHSVFALLGLIIGVMAAVKFSFIATAYLKEAINVPASLLPIISFVIVFLLVVFFIRVIAWLLEKILKVLALNFVNKLAGGLLWSIIVIFIFSTIIWFANKSNFITDSWKQSSQLYFYLEPLSPVVISLIGEVIPFFQGMFDSLDELFKNAAENSNGMEA